MKKPKKPKHGQSTSEGKSSLPARSDGQNLGDIRDDIEQVLDGVVQRNKKGEVVDQLVQVVSQEIYSGPLPHPKHLQAYELACPGAADRIIAMAEKTQDAHIEISKQMIIKEGNYRMLGMALGFATLVILIGASLTAAHLGYLVLATGFIGVGVIGTIGRFIDGRRGANSADIPEDETG